MGVLISNDGQVTLPCALLTLGIPFLAIGKYRCDKENFPFCSSSTLDAENKGDASSILTETISSLLKVSNQPFQLTIGIFFISISFIIITMESNFFKSILKRRGKFVMTEEEIETELMSTHYTFEEIVQQISDAASQYTQRFLENVAANVRMESCKETSKLNRKVVCCLNSLALKIDSETKKYIDGNEKDSKETCQRKEQLLLSSQEASYKMLRLANISDQIICAALSLLALTAKYDIIRERHLKKSTHYSLDLPIQVMRLSLTRTKDQDIKPNVINEEKEEQKEQFAAEVQRKGCLYLGALADGHVEIANQIVQNNGLEAILEGIYWFRYHLHVINWGLWAIFILCYDHVANKCEFIRLNGIGKVLRVMKNVLSDDENNDNEINDIDQNKEGLEVARHGVAILFDLMRHDSTSGQSGNEIALNFMQIRKIALNAGLHDVIIVAMNKFPDNTQIMMMGQQMLIATGYTGQMPQFQGAIVPKR
mmetsp:Transcript_618/g.862  ORF Transcript_618/g.862 Transcript_618/m.862 type:complete len:482 (-) Transcript_618:435-1880(-)